MIPQYLSAIWAALARPMANHLWQSTAFLAAAWLLTLALRKNHARVRFWLWLAASIKFLIPFALLISLGSGLSRSGNTAVAQSGFYSAVEEISLPFSQTVAPIVKPVPHTQHFAFLSLLPELLLAAWLFGFAAVLGLWWLRWRRVSAAMQSALPMSHGREVDALRQLEQMSGIRKPIAFLLSRDSLEPGIFGIVRPVLLWPAGISKHLDDAHLKAILAHEVWHVRRRDNLAAAIHMIVEAVFWFHPLVWWLGARLVEERERACDEEVLPLGNQAHTYAEGILKTCEFCVGSPLSCVSGVTGSDLKQRIVRIMSERVARKLDFSRKLLLGSAGLVALTVPIVFGLANMPLRAQTAPSQGIAGTWQGTLHAGTDLRIVLKISKADGGGWKAVFYSIDQAGQPLAVDSITLDGSTLKMTIKLLGGSYVGKLSADGQSIPGTWTQGQPLPLVLTRATPETAWTIPPPPPPIPPMAAAADPSFEVATIKPNNSGASSTVGLLMVRGRYFTARNTSLGHLISYAYEVQAKQVIGGPDWVSNDRYDIDAVPDQEGVPNSQQLKVMIRKLLADRFRLKFHHEKRELSAYVLLVGRNGQKLAPTQLNRTLPGFGFQPAPGGLTLTVRNGTMADFTHFLQSLVLDRPVVDQTGMTGRFDFQFTFTPDDSEFNGHPPLLPQQNTDATNSAPAAPGLFEAIQQQLGLKLNAEKVPVDVLVIDHIEKPSPN